MKCHENFLDFLKFSFPIFAHPLLFLISSLSLSFKSICTFSSLPDFRLLKVHVPMSGPDLCHFRKPVYVLKLVQRSTKINDNCAHVNVIQVTHGLVTAFQFITSNWQIFLASVVFQLTSFLICYYQEKKRNVLDDLRWYTTIERKE